MAVIAEKGMKCFYLAMQMDMKFGQFHQGKNQTNLITILSCILIRKEPHGAFLKAGRAGR